jgi:hypothetical protein
MSRHRETHNAQTNECDFCHAGLQKYDPRRLEQSRAKEKLAQGKNFFLFDADLELRVD